MIDLIPVTPVKQEILRASNINLMSAAYSQPIAGLEIATDTVTET